MANEQNLKVPTSIEARENGKKGGIASGKKRRENKTFRELFTAFLNSDVKIDQLKEQMKQFGIEDLSNKNAITMAMFKEAVKGNTQASLFIRDTMGEKPIEQVQNINPPQIVIERPKE